MKQLLNSIFCRVAEAPSCGGAANLHIANSHTSNLATQHNSNSASTPRLRDSATPQKSNSASTPRLRNSATPHKATPRLRDSATPLFILLITLLSYNNLNAQTITAKQRDVIIIDNGAPGKADPEDRIMYDVTISNSGGTQGNNTQLNISPDPRTTFIPGSFKSSPLALDDAYTCTGNVGINVPVGSSVILNDFDDNIPGLTVTAGTFATTQGGSIMLAADGSFMYTPPAGFTGADTYVYTLNDGNTVGPPVPATNTGTITITVSNMIWFISNIGGGSGGAGTLTNPFKTIADFNGSAGPLINQLIFLTNTGTDYTNGIVLKNGQTLFGSGHTGGVTLADVVPFSMAPNSKVLPAINGTNPNILNTAGIAVSLASGNKLRGFNVGSSATHQNGSGLSGTAVGNLTIDELSIYVSGVSAGKGINLVGGGTVAIQLVQLDLVSCNPIAIDLSNLTGGTWNVSGSTNISSSSTINVNIVTCSNNFTFSTLNITNGGSHGLSLTGCSGNFTINGGTITNPFGTSVLISGGSVVFNSSGTITDNSGFAVDIDNHDSNNVTFSGNIFSSGTGIRVQNCGGGTKTFSGSTKSLITTTNTAVTLSTNTGATINISGGGLVINTTSGTGYSATGGGTVSVTGTGNTITSTTGTGLNVVSTTIGGSNMTFQRITSNGSGSANGINLDNTGSVGGLIVTGTGSAGSGGTIANKTGADGTSVGCGIYLNNTAKVSLSRMQLNDFTNYAIRGTSVTDFTLQNSQTSGVNGNNGGADEGSIIFDGLFGTCNFTNNTIKGGIEDNFRIININGVLNVTITGNTIRDNSTTSSGNDNINIRANITANITATVTSNIFAACNGDHFQTTCIDDATMNLTFTGNTLSGGGGGSALGQGITISGGAAGSTESMTFNVSNNNMTGTIAGGAININHGAGGGTWVGDVMNNTIGNPAITDSGASQSSGIRFETHGNGSLQGTVSGNTISQWSGAGGGISLSAGDSGGADNGTLNVKVLNNTFSNPGANADYCIYGPMGQLSSNANVVCEDIANNNMVQCPQGSGFKMRVRARFNTVVHLPGYGGATNDVPALQAYFASKNPGCLAAEVSIGNTAPGMMTGGPACF